MTKRTAPDITTELKWNIISPDECEHYRTLKRPNGAASTYGRAVSAQCKLCQEYAKSTSDTEMPICTGWTLQRLISATKPDSILTHRNRQELLVHGVTVVENVLPYQNAIEAQNFLLAWLEDLGVGIERDRLVETLSKPELLETLSKKIVTYPPASFTPAAIYVRTFPRVRQVFSEIYGVGDESLITSYDRMGISVPATTRTENGHTTDIPEWYHIDQGSRILGFHAYQASINLTATSAEGGGFACYPGSHLYHKDFLETMPQKIPDFDVKDNFLKPNKGDGQAALRKFLESYELAPRIIRPLPLGAMVIWDSRLVHASVPPRFGMKEVRMVSYVCMVPRSKATTPNLIKRRKYALEARGTSHWPQFVNVFPKGRPYHSSLKDNDPFNVKWTDYSSIKVLAIKYFEAYAVQREDLPTVVRHYGFDGLVDYFKWKRSELGDKLAHNEMGIMSQEEYREAVAAAGKLAVDEEEGDSDSATTTTTTTTTTTIQDT